MVRPAKQCRNTLFVPPSVETEKPIRTIKAAAHAVRLTLSSLSHKLPEGWTFSMDNAGKLVSEWPGRTWPPLTN